MPPRAAEKTQLQALRPPPPQACLPGNRQFQISIVPSRLGKHGSCDVEMLNRSGPLTVFVPISKPGASREQ